MSITNLDALILVDLQNDFCRGGPLGVPSSDAVVKSLSALAKAFAAKGGKVFATRDWHPAEHSSFQTQGGQWPEHCIQGTQGAEFHPDLELPKGSSIVNKGMSVGKDAYSGFVDSDLNDQLRKKGINRLYVGGLATDNCVLNTVLDAIYNDYETYVVTDAVAAVNVEPGDGIRAIHLMQVNGALLTRTSELIADP